MKKRILKFNIRTKESLFFRLVVAEVFRFSKREYNWNAVTKDQQIGESYPKFTGSMSTASVTSSGSASDWMMRASSRLNALIVRVRSMIW
jgi:hypothetical protein